jgi:hypothetical protein
MNSKKQHGVGRGVRKRERTLARLQREERALTKRLGRIEREVESLQRTGADPRSVDRWLSALSAGLPELAPLPADFSRADLYNDHD